MSFILPIVAGVAGTLVMTFFLRRARFLHLPETQMVRAVGSILTKDEQTALMPGFAIHMIMGIVFAFAYNFLLHIVPFPESGPHIVWVTCTIIGLVHGILVTFFLAIAVAQYHPVDRFRELTPGDMASHVIAHMAYGLTVGLVLAFVTL